MLSGNIDDDDDDDDDDAVEFRTARNDRNSCNSSLSSLQMASKFDRRRMSADGCDALSTTAAILPLTVIGIDCECGNGGDNGSCLASSSSELHIMYTVRRRFYSGKE